MASTGPMGYTTAQAVNVSRFTPPQLDLSAPIAEFVDWHMQWSESHTYAILAGEEGQDNVPITWGEFGRAVHRLASRIVEVLPEGAVQADGKLRTIAVLSSNSGLIYCTVVLAIMRAGFEPFPLSNANSLPALKELLFVTGTDLLVGSDGAGNKQKSALEETVSTLISDLASTDRPVRLIQFPSVREIYSRLSEDPVPPYDRDLDRAVTHIMPSLSSPPGYMKELYEGPGIIVHSSGSTKFPKPIRLKRKTLLYWLAFPWYGELDVGGNVWNGFAWPTFHIGGIFAQIGIPLTCGATVAMFKPKDKPAVASPESVLLGAKKTNVETALFIPSFLEAWSQDTSAMKYLATLKAVYTGSGPLPQDAGDRLVRAGVNLMTLYGASETGMLSMFSAHTAGADWQYFKLASFFKYRTKPDDEEGSALKLIVEASDCYTPALTNTAGENAYDTSDLFEAHPSIQGMYKILGRADDQITHVTGEKTNPGPLENVILGSPLIKSAIYFGHARPQPGIVVEPTSPVDLSSSAQIADFRNAIYPLIEKANKLAPAHSRVFKEYILVGDILNKPFSRVAKGTVQRSVVLRQYQDEISEIYAAVNRYDSAERAKPDDWSPSSIRAFIHRMADALIYEKTGRSLDDDRDLFEQGCDSSLATIIRTAITETVRGHFQGLKGQNTPETRSMAKNIVPPDIVFAYPTVTKLATFIVGLTGGSADGPMYDRDRGEDMRLTLSKHIASLPLRLPVGTMETEALNDRVSTADDPIECVLITGTTGTLGAYLLEGLLRNSKVMKVFAINRKSDTLSMAERQRVAFSDRNIDPDLINRRNLCLLEGDLEQPGLGVGADILDRIRSSVTTIIHNAWRLDFNLRLTSFEPNMMGSRNLVSLALSSRRRVPPQLLFTSTMATTSNWRQGAPVPEDAIADVSVAIGSGYQESKWVVDQMLYHVSSACSLRTTSFRIGQLCGSNRNGSWNVTDWVPHMVKAGPAMGSLPIMNDEALTSWLPVDAAADCIIEAMFAPTEGHRILHLVHPRPIQWNIVMRLLASLLESRGHTVDVIPFEVWLSKLEASNEQDNGGKLNPATKLLEFFRRGAAPVSSDAVPFREAMGFPILETVKTRKICTTLAGIPSLDGNDVRRWMDYWGKHGLLQ